MLKQIEEARFLGTREQDGRRWVEVLVTLRDEPDASYKASVEKQGGQFHLSSVVREEADRALDWFDNDLHAATANVTDAWFGQADVEANWTEREAFLQDLLEHPEVGTSIKAAL